MNILVIDGNNLVFRFAAAMKNSTKEKIISTMLNNIRSEVNKRNIEFLLVACDYGASSFRTKIFPEYKAQRKKQREKTPADIKATEKRYEVINEFIQVLRILGIPIFYKYGIEADDLIAFVATYTQEPVTIISTDKDFLQLVSPKVTVYSPVKDIEYKPNVLLKDLPFLKPSDLRAYLVLLKTISGDNSDNIPNIPKVGEVTCNKILEQFFTNTLTDKHKEILQENAEQLKLNRQLVDLTRLPLDFQDMIYKELLNCLQVAYKMSQNSENLSRISEKYIVKLTWVQMLNSMLFNNIQKFVKSLTYSKIVEGE